jgi:hypothetical protein
VKKFKVWLLVVAGVLLPVALAFAAYFISTGFSASAEIPAVPAPRMDQTSTEHTSPSPDAHRGSDDRTRGSDDTSSPTPSVTSSSTSTPAPTVTDDHGGKCLEPEHVNDPSCPTGSGGGSGSGDDSSGSSSGSSGSGSNSGSGGDD